MGIVCKCRTCSRDRSFTVQLVTFFAVAFDPCAQMGTIMEATVQCVEEAIANALVAAESTVGRNGNTAFALPHTRLLEILKKYNRLEV